MKLSGKGYVCAAGEHFDEAALTLFGDEKYAAELLNANPALCRKTVFEGGEILHIPVLDTEDAGRTAAETAPWKGR